MTKTSVRSARFADLFVGMTRDTRGGLVLRLAVMVGLASVTIGAGTQNSFSEGLNSMLNDARAKHVIPEGVADSVQGSLDTLHSVVQGLVGNK